MVNCADHNTNTTLVPYDLSYKTLRQAGLTSKNSTSKEGVYESTRIAYCPPDGSILYKG
jgi:hypothetical protein